MATSKVRRFDTNPIITPDMLPGKDGSNINGPSLIRAPDFIRNPLGRYYLYFAHHGGKYIRLAHADEIAGPWKIYEPGTLQLKQAPGAQGHIASPDVVVDPHEPRLRMYFHGQTAAKRQRTFLATSVDGLRFRADDQFLGPFYFRVFTWRGHWYAISKGGQMHRSPDGLSPFERIAGPLGGPDDPADPDGNRPGTPRHLAVHLRGDELDVYYSSIGDKPESIVRRTITLADDPLNWKISAPQLILKPEMAYEGADLPARASVAGASSQRENGVRDPCIFVEDGHVYLIYSIAGEHGLAIAEVT